MWGPSVLVQPIKSLAPSRPGVNPALLSRRMGGCEIDNGQNFLGGIKFVPRWS